MKKDNSSAIESTQTILARWRSETLSKLIRLSLFFGFVAIIIVVVTDTIKYPDQIIQLVVYLCIFVTLTIVALYPKINYRVKGWIFLVSFFLLAIFALLRGGLAGVGRLYLLILPVLSIILIDLAAAFLITIISLSTMLVFIYLASRNVLAPWYLESLSTDPFNPQYWITETLYTSLLIILVIYLLKNFYQLLIQVIDIERGAREEANEAKKSLVSANKTLEEKVIERTSELEFSMQEAIDARSAAESANRAKSAFLATMSHEIRTPLNAILGMANLLIDTPLTIQQNQFVETIRASGESLLAVITNILDFSKIEAERIGLEKKPIALRQCVESIVDSIMPQAREKRLAISITFESNVPSVFIGDEIRLRQVLLNLINNSIKFSEMGEIEISVRSDQVSEHENQDLFENEASCRLTFSIRDTGSGIPDQVKETLFQPFTQGDSSPTRRYGGTGLGLVISKRLVEMMNGSIWYESQEGAGSTFFFTVVGNPAVGIQNAPRLESRLNLRDKRILIVDDQHSDRRILAIQFQAWNMQTKATASANEALQWIRRGETFDIAVINLENNEVDGISLCREIHKLKSTQSLPIILTTSARTTLDHTDIDQLCTVLPKPIKASLLYNTLIPIFAGELEEILRANDFSPLFDARMASRHPLEILLVEDNLINQNLTLLMLEKLGYQADVTVNGTEALHAVKLREYDVILMDIQMPEMDGIEATRHIRIDSSLVNQPRIIAMTANALSGDREMCLKAGMDDYISKPVRIEELVNSLTLCQPKGVREKTNLSQPSGISTKESIITLAENLPIGSVKIDEVIRLKEILGQKAGINLPTQVSAELNQAETLINRVQVAYYEHDEPLLSDLTQDFLQTCNNLGAHSLLVIANLLNKATQNRPTEGISGIVLQANVEIDRIRNTLGSES